MAGITGSGPGWPGKHNFIVNFFRRQIQKKAVKPVGGPRLGRLKKFVTVIT
jgi:hypothetical protein